MASGEEKRPSESFKLIAAEASYYSGKVRAYLRFKGIPFEEVLPTAKVYRSIIVPLTGVKFIPVIITPEKIVIQDTSDIIDYLEARFPTPIAIPKTPLQRLVSFLFELYADEWLILPAMHYRWNFPEQRKYILMEFGRASNPRQPFEQQLATAKSISNPFSSSLPFLGVNSETVPEIEKSFLKLLELLSKHFEIHPYLLGGKPTLADFAMIGPFYAHLYRDPVPGKLIRCQAPLVAEWIERTQGLHPSRTHLHQISEQNPLDLSKVEDEGELLPNDEIPPTLFPILHIIFEEHFPVLLDTVPLLKQWFAENPTPTNQIPRSIGTHQFRIGSVTSERLLFPYSIWMLQRAVDCYQEIHSNPKDRQKVDSFLQSIHSKAPEYLQVDLNGCRVKRLNNKLVRSAL